jgi:magnesium transporter
MRKLKFPRTPKAGLPPGSLVHVGEPQTAQVKTRQLIYDTRGSEESEAISWAYLESPGKPDGVTWINMDGVHEAEPMARMGKHFHLHPLTLEDIMNTAQRPKTEDYDDYIFIVLKKFSIEEDTGLIKSEQVSIVLGSQLLLSFQEVDDDIFDGVRERIRKGKGRIRDSGADYLAYALVDAIVDQYFAILETLGNRLETLDERNSH